jgi:N6-L-threonylcarbamoyladenine synthase
LLLSIESSCDDSAIAITEINTLKLIYHKKISQIEHAKFGGVVPELAARLHAEALPNLLDETKKYFNQLRAIAVTNRPGLNVSLMEGVIMAKALSLGLDIPIIDVNHLKGHIYSLFIEKPELFPISILLVSGGHTMIIEANSLDDMEIIANSMDDSFGESFDKTSKMLGFSYPGGPIVEKLAKDGDKNRFAFSIPLSQSKQIAFSYSGLKNAVRLAVQNNEQNNKTKSDIAASFQHIATAHLLQKTKKYFKQKKDIKNFAIVGGASANLYLRKKYKNLCDEFDIKLHLAPLQFCSDNAAMIGRIGVAYYNKDRFCNIDELIASPKSNLQ